MSDYEHDGNIFTGYEDELREHREYRKYDYGCGSSGKGPKKSGCLSTILTGVVLSLIVWGIERLLGWR